MPRPRRPHTAEQDSTLVAAVRDAPPRPEREKAKPRSQPIRLG